MRVREVAAAARNLDLPGRRVMVAVSGGVDSVVLFHALHRLAGSLDLDLYIGHVNHGLRGEESEGDESAVRALADKYDVPVCVARVDPKRLRRGRGSRERPTLQEAARRARYDALRAMAEDHRAERLATAHTLDDQAETVLLRIVRGSGPDGLGGIPERSSDGFVVRPLLRIARDQILSYAKAQGLSWREDSSNADPAFARARLRARWLPGLRDAFNPRLLRAIGDLAEAQRRDSEWIAEIVEREAERFLTVEDRGLRIARSGWEDLPEALARRLVRLALRRTGAARDISRVHLERVVNTLRCGRPGSSIQLPGGLELSCEHEAFHLRRAPVREKGAC
jgi:tRNA(Ile)-lysidine synthase